MQLVVTGHFPLLLDVAESRVRFRMCGLAAGEATALWTATRLQSTVKIVEACIVNEIIRLSLTWENGL